MSERKPLIDTSIIQKGEARPISNQPAWKLKTPVTVRLDDERYRKLMAVSSSRIPRKTHQQILVEALDMYFNVQEL